MNIALIGAPGSGKSELGQRLVESLGGHNTERNVALVDNYVQAVERKAMIAVGPLSDYLGNMFVALERYGQERRKRDWAETTITCGTLIETAVYMAMHFVSLANILDDAGKSAAGPQMEAVLRMLAVLYNDIFTYDYAFYLPPRQGDEDTVFMDHQLQAGLAGFKLVPVTALINADTQLEEALEALKVEAPAR